MSEKYDVTKFGAQGDGKTNDTIAIQKAIDTCNENGGGIVSLLCGTYIAGTLYLKSNVYMEIAPSAKLMASSDIRDYGDGTHYNRYRNEHDLDRCFLYAENAENFGLTGYGEINGNAEAFPNRGSIYRPMMMRFLNCKRIHIENLKLYNAAAWTTAFLDSEDIWVNGVEIRNEKRYNGDGLDFDGCRHVYVSNCRIIGTDDNLCLQSSSKEYPMQNVHITNCEFTSICAAVRIGLKSIGTISDVVITNCTMHEVWREGIKIECTEGGNITDIIINNIIMHNVTRPLFVLLNNRYETDGLGSSISMTQMPEIGTLKRIHISNVIARDDEEMKNVHVRFDNDIMGRPEFNGIRFDAEEGHPIEDVLLQNIRYTCIGGVKNKDIPAEYPKVLDQILFPDCIVSENYYPDWSRTTFLDMRNIKNLLLENIFFSSIYEDGREPYLLDKCSLIKAAAISVVNCNDTNRK